MNDTVFVPPGQQYNSGFGRDIASKSNIACVVNQQEVFNTSNARTRTVFDKCNTTLVQTQMMITTRSHAIIVKKKIESVHVVHGHYFGHRKVLLRVGRQYRRRQSRHRHRHDRQHGRNDVPIRSV